MKNGRVDMLTGSIAKGLLAMAIPIIIMNVMQTLFNIVDMTLLGRFADDTAVGAVGSCGILITLCNSLMVGISMGANVIVARHLGSGDAEKTEKAMGTAIAFSVTGGMLLLVIGISCAEIFLRWINCPESILSEAALYFRIYFAGAPVLFLYSFAGAIIRAMGEARRQMTYSLIGGGLKVLLNLFFVTVFKMRVEGVAVATIISNAVSGVLCLAVIFKSKDRVNLTIKKIRIHLDELKSILYIGVPVGVQSSLYSLANAVIAAAVNSFGPDATTGISIANQFDGLLYQIIHSPSLAVMPYVAQNAGAKQVDRVKQVFGKGVLITVIMGASLGMLSAIFSKQLSSIMSSTPEVIAYSQQKMIIISSTYFICGINEVLGGVLKGMGKPFLPTIATLIYMCVFRFVWVYLIFPLCPNLTFLYLVWPIGWILSIVTLFVPYRNIMKKFEREVKAEGV